ncbi:hypothetical protein MVEN_00447200 [Mycena venus]|uniref:Uncharacterized protein n=1 Tax=Mycena venus TaxID=2733690 RepID=A0A8H6YW12_9AGAR|nr:hypothetical protein MVEN_00447200 [Mycena venus]
MFSFTKTLVVVLLNAAGVLSTLTVNIPSSPQSGATTTITWTSDSSDPTFSIELSHPSFNAAIAIANNVDPTLNQITVELPIVPGGDQYTLEFVNITDINQVFAMSGDFSIAAAASPSASASAIPSTTSASFSVPLGGSSTPTAMSSGSAGSPGSPSVTSPSSPTSVATNSQSAALSGASTSSSQSTTSSDANSVVLFSGSAVHLALAFGTILVAGAWII